MKKTITVISIAASFMLSASMLGAVQQSDNTKTNKGDAQAGAVTADKQPMNASDQQITQKIRQAIVHDKTLSTYAHNVKIVTQDGVVTLKGPVRSDAEKANVEAKATAVVGDTNVKDEISIAPAKSGS